jgi:hypothetical protein
MRRIKTFLISYWELITWVLLGVAIVVWIYLIGKSLTISLDTFNIFCVSLAALLGGLIGISVAAMAIYSQYSGGRLRENRDILYIEKLNY